MAASSVEKPERVVDDQKHTGADKIEFADAQAATAKEHSLTLSQALKAYPKAIMWSILLSSAVVMEGYDTLLVFPSTLTAFLNSGRSLMQSCR